MWGPILAWIRLQIGQRTDAASATGSLHAKVATILAKNVIVNDSVIKSIQRGVITITSGQTTATATISSVTTGKTMLNFLGSRRASSSSENHNCTLTLTNATTVTARRDGTLQDAYVGFEVIEFY